MFNSYVELHTVQLGVLLGLFVGLLYRKRPRPAYALLFLGVLSAFGNASHSGFARELDVATEIEAKPWYFLPGLYATTVASLLLVRYGSTIFGRLRSVSVPDAGAESGGTADDVVVTDEQSPPSGGVRRL